MLSLILAVVGGPDSALRSITSLAAAIDRAGAGDDADIVIVDCTTDPEVEDFLRKVSGARVVAGPPADPVRAWLSAFALTAGDLVWLGTTDSEVPPDALLDLRTPLDGSTAGTLLGKGAGVSGVFRRDALRAAAASPPPSGSAPDRLLRALAAGRTGGAPRPARIPTVEEALRLSPGFKNAELYAKHPSCFEAGIFTYAGAGTKIISYQATDRIRIGKYCSIADEVVIVNGGTPDEGLVDLAGEPVTGIRTRGAHRSNGATSYPMGILVPDAPYVDPPRDGSVVGGSVDIGHDVWVGYGARIVGPVKIGNGAQVAFSAVVMSDVPPYAIVAGNPAKVVRMRFSRAVVARLERLRWWDWPPERVLENWHWFCEPITAFLDHFDPQEEAPSA